MSINIAECWVKAKEIISENIGPAAYEAWLSRLELREANYDTLVLVAPDKFTKDWINTHYLGLMEGALEKIAMSHLKVELLAQESNQEASAPTVSALSRIPPPQDKGPFS